MELQVIRTIHPVGQGAFYLETLHRPNSQDDKHIVYDCGTLSSRNRLYEEIDDCLPGGSIIDVCFISHFHADHVNGIKRLSDNYKIKYVVLPQIDDYEWFYVVENYLSTGEPNVNLISDIRENLRNARIIQVAPMYGDSEERISDESMSLDYNNGVAIINGLSPLVIGNAQFSLWHYVVVNPLFKKDIEALKAEILNIQYENRKIVMEDLQNPTILVTIKNKLQEAYVKVFKGGNEYSMCMLSELANRRQYESQSYFNCGIRCYCRYGYNRDGCLYCGDADFLHSDTLACLKSRLGGREDNVGLLQLPHHGSKENFNVDLLNWLSEIQASFACYGTPNRYHHPSNQVMGTARTFGCVWGVNQYKSNVLSERIDVFPR